MPRTADRFSIFAFVILAATYASLLLVIITIATGRWSDVASYTYLYLLFIAPIVTSVIAYETRQTRRTSTRHQFLFYAGALYCFIGIAVLAFFTLFQF